MCTSVAHAERDLHNFLSPGYPVQPFQLELDMLSKDGIRTKGCIFAIPPHEMFSAVYHWSPEQFSRSFLGRTCETSAAEFWQDACRSDWGKTHPAHVLQGSRIDRVVPLSVHSDGVETFNDVEYHVFSFSSILTHKGLGDELDKIFLVACIDESRMVPDITHSQIVRFIKWSIAALSSGLFPEVDHMGNNFAHGSDRARWAGQPIAGEWRAVFCSWLGDTKERVKAHQLQRNWQAKLICEHCMACPTLSMCNPYDFRPAAGWRELLISDMEYEQTENLSPYAGLKGLYMLKIIR